jgi:hypothetical protein
MTDTPSSTAVEHHPAGTRVVDKITGELGTITDKAIQIHMPPIIRGMYGLATGTPTDPVILDIYPGIVGELPHEWLIPLDQAVTPEGAQSSLPIGTRVTSSTVDGLAGTVVPYTEISQPWTFGDEFGLDITGVQFDIDPSDNSLVGGIFIPTGMLKVVEASS